MRILYLAHRTPFPPNKGDKIRSFHELRGLAERGHEVHLLAFADDPRDLRPENRAALAQICATIGIRPLNRRVAMLKALASLLRGDPFTLGYFSSRAMRRDVDRLLADVRPRAIVVYSSSMAQYIPPALASRTLLDMIDVDSEKWGAYARTVAPPQSWVYAIESRRLGAYEQTIIRRFARTLVTTPRERTTLLGAVGDPDVRTRVHALPNGVDLERFRPGTQGTDFPMSESDRRFLDRERGPLVVFTGAMDYRANVDGARYFAVEVLPLVRARVPDAEFMVVGSTPTSDVKRLGELPGVTITGTVDDVRPYVAAAAVCVAPLRIARGVQNKILEAMAMGRVVVATPEAAAGLSATAGRDLLIGRTAEEFADVVVTVIQVSAIRDRVGRNARLFVERHHDWRLTLDSLSDIVGSVARDRDVQSGGHGPEIS